MITWTRQHGKRNLHTHSDATRNHCRNITGNSVFVGCNVKQLHHFFHSWSINILAKIKMVNPKKSMNDLIIWFFFFLLIFLRFWKIWKHLYICKIFKINYNWMNEDFKLRKSRRLGDHIFLILSINNAKIIKNPSNSTLFFRFTRTKWLSVPPDTSS